MPTTVKISDLPPYGSPQSTDVVPIVDGTCTYKISLRTLSSFFTGSSYTIPVTTGVTYTNSTGTLTIGNSTGGTVSGFIQVKQFIGLPEQ